MQQSFWGVARWLADVNPGCDVCGILVALADKLGVLLLFGYVLVAASLYYLTRHRDWPWFFAYILAMAAELLFRPEPSPVWWFSLTRPVILLLRLVAFVELGNRIMLVRTPVYRRRAWWVLSLAALAVAGGAAENYNFAYPVIAANAFVAVGLMAFSGFAVVAYLMRPTFRMPHVKQHMCALLIHCFSYGVMILTHAHATTSAEWYGIQVLYRLDTLAVSLIWIAPAVRNLASRAVVAGTAGRPDTVFWCRAARIVLRLRRRPQDTELARLRELV
jgi:hypothetical protein